MVAQVLAIDYGLKRVGVAIGNTLTKNAEPLETIENKNDELTLARLTELVNEWQPKQIIMGMPYNPNPQGDISDKRTDKTSPEASNKSKKERQLEKQIKTFAARLSERVELPIEFIDESFSSSEASRQMKLNRQSGKRKKSVNKADIDKAAASIILQRWLDQYA